jgi:hypothetical protein
MTIKYNKCASCNNKIESFDHYDAGYHEGYRSRNYTTLIPFEERTIELPEISLRYINICEDCINKDPSLKTFRLKQRLNYYKEKVSDAKKYITNAKNAKKKANKKIKELKVYIDILNSLKIKVKEGEVVTGKDVPECPARWDETY